MDEAGRDKLWKNYISTRSAEYRDESVSYTHLDVYKRQPIDGLRPCANVMYKSLVQCNYDEITCVVLTGMGADGTEGIKTLSASHKKIHVIAQDEDSCVCLLYTSRCV